MQCAGSMEMGSLSADSRAHPLGKHRQTLFQDPEDRDPSPCQTSSLPVCWVRFRACEWGHHPPRLPAQGPPGPPARMAQTRRSDQASEASSRSHCARWGPFYIVRMQGARCAGGLQGGWNAEIWPRVFPRPGAPCGSG